LEGNAVGCQQGVRGQRWLSCWGSGPTGRRGVYITSMDTGVYIAIIIGMDSGVFLARPLLGYPQ
jgi:hypothetical protein